MCHRALPGGPATDVAAETAWDERALAAHAGVADEDLAPVGIASAAAMLPSLHLNLGDDYRRAGDPVKAREQLVAARRTESLLAADGYGTMIRGGIQRLADRLDS